MLNCICRITNFNIFILCSIAGIALHIYLRYWSYLELWLLIAKLGNNCIEVENSPQLYYIITIWLIVFDIPSYTNSLYQWVLAITTAITSISTTENSTTENQLVCYHQCNTCGIIFDCVETRQKCKLPFSSYKTKCVSCA